MSLEQGIYVLCKYYNKLPYEVGELTMIQFNKLLAELGRSIDWDLQVALLPVSGKFSDKSVYPLYPAPDPEQGKSHLNTTSTLEDFVNKYLNRR